MSNLNLVANQEKGNKEQTLVIKDRGASRVGKHANPSETKDENSL